MMGEVIRRVCGHEAIFIPKNDCYDDARRQKLRSKRCHACGLLANQEHNAAQKAKQLLPEGAVFTVGQCGGAWHGTLMADGIEVSAETGTAHGAPEELTVHPGDTVEWTAQVV